MKSVKNQADRSTIEVEYEKNKGQCTFKPQINQVQATVVSHNNINRQLEEKKSPRSINDLRGAQKSIERMQKARERQDEIKYFQETGRLVKHRNVSPQAAVAPPQLRAKSREIKPVAASKTLRNNNNAASNHASNRLDQYLAPPASYSKPAKRSTRIQKQ